MRRGLLALGLLLLALGTAHLAEAQDAVTWQLGQPTWQNRAPTSPNVRLDDIQFNAQGGFARVTGLNDGECAPGAGMPAQGITQRFLFRWFFDRDISQLRYPQEITVRFLVEGDQSPCMQLNPIIELKGEVNHLQFFGGRFHPFPAPDHDGNPRKIKVWRPDAIYPQTYFNINIWGFRGNRPFDLMVTYPYTRVVAQPQPGIPADRSVQDMIARSRSDSRFGAPITGSQGADVNWSAGYELRWVDFVFAGTQRVRIYHATSKANPAMRWTIYYDPVAGTWRGWVAAS